MSSKKATDEELLAQFDDLGGEPHSTLAPKKPTSTTGSATKTAQDEADPLAELENLAQERPASRAHTPRVGTGAIGGGPPPKPPATAGDEKAQSQTQTRKSGESTRGFHQSFTPTVEDANAVPRDESVAAATQAASGGGGSWWGGLMATANAAVKQAEALAKEIQKNEEAQRWAEQVKGNVGALRTYGGELRSKALPTFTNILHTLAPPISSHERLQIHITHDFIGYPSLDPLIYQTFSRVMAQVEGGELMVVQRGQESAPRRGDEAGYIGNSTAGWNDGPWWKQTTEKRDLGSVKGLVEGTKLIKVSAESYATDYFAAKGGVEEAAKQATEVLSESNPTRSSDIFLAIQAISYIAPQDLFGCSAKPSGEEESGVSEPEEKPEESVCFAIYLHDPIHGIAFHSVTQSMPQKWVGWLDNLVAMPEEPQGRLPDEIQEIIQTGGVDPREWVSEWVEELLALGVGIVAQRYVARRMGVGEGGIGKGKAREAMVDAGAGEAARAM